MLVVPFKVRFRKCCSKSAGVKKNGWIKYYNVCEQYNKKNRLSYSVLPDIWMFCTSAMQAALPGDVNKRNQGRNSMMILFFYDKTFLTKPSKVFNRVFKNPLMVSAQKFKICRFLASKWRASFLLLPACRSPWHCTTQTNVCPEDIKTGLNYKANNLGKVHWWLWWIGFVFFFCSPVHVLLVLTS